MSIKIENLKKTYKNGTEALKGIDLEIKEGVYGLLGENGAGKTTLMRILLTLMEPSEGKITIGDMEITPANYKKIRNLVGYLPQELGLYPNLTVKETLEYMAGLYDLDKETTKQRIDYYLEATSLKPHQNKKNRQLSGGMKRRVGLVQAMLNDPRILIVDEPTTGLDPEERIRIRNLLVSFSRDKTILFSTHVVEDIAATSTTCAILKKGEVVYKGKIKELLEQCKNDVWSVTLQDEGEYQRLQEKMIVTGKQYVEGGIDVRFISENSPSFRAVSKEATLEDAYIYIVNKK